MKGESFGALFLCENLVNSEKSRKFAAGMMKRWLYILIGFALADGFLLEPEVNRIKRDTAFLRLYCH